MNWQLAKRSVIIFIPLALIAAGMPYGLHRAEVDEVTKTQQANVARLIDIIRQRVSYTLTGTIADLTYLADQSALQDWLNYPDLLTYQRLTSEHVVFANHMEMHNQIRFVDLQGRKLIRVNWDKTGASRRSAWRHRS